MYRYASKTPHYSAKKERMRKLLEDLDTEHLNKNQTRPDSNTDTQSNTSHDTSRDSSCDVTLEEEEYSGLRVRSPPDYFQDSVLPGEVYFPPEIGESCDDMSLPSVPSYFDIQDTEDTTDVEESITPRDYDVTPREHDVTPRDYDVTPRDYDVTPRDFDVSPRDYDVTPRDHDLTPRDLDSSVGSCDTVILNTALKRDLSSKPTQTLALPFRLVQYLPIEGYKERGVVERVDVEGNCVATQVDMSPHFQVSVGFDNVRQELKWLDHETQLQVRQINKHVIC